MFARLKEFLLRQRRPFGRLKFTLESILVIAGTIALILGVWHHFRSADPPTFPGEGKRVVAFRQVTNRICTENRKNMRVAVTEARSRVERLGYVARALGWDLNDLEGITAPPTRFDGFLDELATRRQLRSDVLALQRSVELGNRGDKATALADVERLEAESRELSREIGIVRCMRALPDVRDLMSQDRRAAA
jgi:hypothetical protein